MPESFKIKNNHITLHILQVEPLQACPTTDSSNSLLAAATSTASIADDRRQKHVSFDSSSLMRSQTLATMDEASFQRMAAMAQAASVASQNMNVSPSKSSERLIDGRKTPDFEFYSQIFPPELARQIMMGEFQTQRLPYYLQCCPRELLIFTFFPAGIIRGRTLSEV